MDRGEGRHRDNDLEAIEVELDGPPTAERDPAELDDEVSPAAGLPANGPPEHWLAYIRARAPGLLEPGGPLATAVAGRGPDVIPHGRMTVRATPPSPDESTGVATPAAAASSGLEPDGAPERRAAERPAASSGDSGDSFGDGAVTPGPTVSANAPTAADPWTTVHHPTSHEAGAPGGFTEAEQTGTGAAREHDLATNDDRIGVISGHVDPINGAPDASRSRAAPVGDPIAERLMGAAADPLPTATIEPATPAPMPTPMPMAPPRDEPWPAVDRPGGTERPSVDPFPTAVPLPPRVLWPTAPDDAYPRRAAATSSDGWPVAWPALPPATDRRTPAQARPDEWRVEAARPDGHTLADLPLPAWPTLPDQPHDDQPDWPAVERRLERAARLDLEQRRR